MEDVVLEDVFGALDRLKPKREAIAQAIRFGASRYFFRESLVKYLLWSRHIDAVPRSEFIDYAAYKRYYADAAHVVEYSRRDETRRSALPYELVIDFVTHPHVMINVEAVDAYLMAPDLLRRTQGNLDRFLTKKPRTTDGSVLRLASLERISDQAYLCRLQTASYFSQVRTNLTIDFPLSEDSALTLRALDSGAGVALRPLRDSLLVNSIGVAAVVFQVGPDGKSFFFKRRRDSEGVFEDMLGSVSGVVSVPAGASIAELLSYVTQEMMREFSHETGLYEDSSPVRKIVPLAFCRELARGGKPQFFFLIELPQIDSAKFGESFRKSREGLEEFSDNILSGAVDYHRALSPEFSANLALAFRYWQKRLGVPSSPITLD